ncbi:MAG: family 16 glycosylhydrolase, partial [Actinomycetes bacterium]
MLINLTLRYRYRALLLALLIVIPLLFLSIGAKTSGATTVQPVGAGTSKGPTKGTYTLDFSPVISGNTIDAASWSKNWFGSIPTAITTGVSGGYDLNCFDPQLVTQSGGLIHLGVRQTTCVTENQQTLPFRGGMIHTANSYSTTYGYFEAQIKFPTTKCTSKSMLPKSQYCISNHPVFWLLSRDNLANSTYQAEIDIAEGLQGQVCNLVHYWQPGVPENRKCVQPTATSAKHTYGVLWEPASVSFYT